MGRTSGAGFLFRVHQYRKLREEQESPDMMAYPCTRCGHLQTFNAEELNSIVGNAFRMAYAAQLQPAFQQVMQQQQTPTEQPFLWNRPDSLECKSGPGPGEEADSPTELNSCRRLADKPPLVKRLAMGTTPTEEESTPPPLIIPSKTVDMDNNRVSDGSDSKIVGPPAPPERTDSLNNRPEDGELKTAPWFQAGIPREITLEVLGQEPVGSFMVRESTSKPGCFALSLRVPHEFQPLGIAHYLILRTNKGYKIKGFTKEFRTLTALITHHSVMPELLPCPLSLSRYNPTYSQQDTRRDFADIDSDPDYNTLADFRRMMADLNV